MMLIAMGCIPRGGVVKAEVVEGGFTVRATGEGAKIFEKTEQVLKGAVQLEEIDARLIQPYYAKRLAEAAGLPLSMMIEGADVVVRAVAVGEAAAPIAQAG
jgi:histidine phosphotransferase ChpT